MNWTEENEAEVERLLANRKSPTLIAALLSQQLGEEVTRNMIIGKAKRKGWQIQSDYAIRMRKFPAKGKEVKAKLILASTYNQRSIRDASAEAAPSAVDQLRDDQCRWPIGDPYIKGFTFCSSSKIPGMSYCVHHTIKSTRPPEEYHGKAQQGYRKAVTIRKKSISEV